MQKANLYTRGVQGVLIRARGYNNQIGSYRQHIINEQFNFSVELDNGRIVIPYTMAQDQESMSSSISEDRIQAVAKRFISNSSATQKFPNAKVQNQVKTSLLDKILKLLRLK